MDQIKADFPEMGGQKVVKKGVQEVVGKGSEVP